jgi:hypothetical protein
LPLLIHQIEYAVSNIFYPGSLAYLYGEKVVSESRKGNEKDETQQDAVSQKEGF